MSQSLKNLKYEKTLQYLHLGRASKSVFFFSIFQQVWIVTLFLISETEPAALLSLACAMFEFKFSSMQLSEWPRTLPTLQRWQWDLSVFCFDHVLLDSSAWLTVERILQETTCFVQPWKMLVQSIYDKHKNTYTRITNPLLSSFIICLPVEEMSFATWQCTQRTHSQILLAPLHCALCRVSLSQGTFIW